MDFFSSFIHAISSFFVFSLVADIVIAIIRYLKRGK